MTRAQLQGEEGMSQLGAGWIPVGVGRREASSSPGELMDRRQEEERKTRLEKSQRRQDGAVSSRRGRRAEKLPNEPAASLHRDLFS